MKVSKKTTNKASRFGNWLVVIVVSTIVLGFASRGVMNYTTKMSEDQRIIASVFVVALCAYVIYVNLIKLIKEK